MNARHPTKSRPPGRCIEDPLNEIARLLARQAVTDQFKSGPGVCHQNTPPPGGAHPSPAKCGGSFDEANAANPTVNKGLPHDSQTNITRDDLFSARSCSLP